MTNEAQQLIDWFEEESGFKQGTKAPHKWVLQAEQELRRQQEEIQALRSLLDSRPAINAALPGSYIEWSGLVYAQSMGQLSPPSNTH